MAHPDIYQPKMGTDIKTAQVVGTLTDMRGVNRKPAPPFGPVGEAIEELGSAVGKAIGGIIGHGGTPGPHGTRKEDLLKLTLPSSSQIELIADPNTVVTSGEGIERLGILLFIKSSDGDWEGPFAPGHVFGWSTFEHPGHTGTPGGDIVIQAAIKNWSDALSYDFLMKVFYR